MVCLGRATLAAIAKTATDKACNECKTQSIGLDYIKMLEHKSTVIFQTDVFLIPVLRNNKSHQAAINSKTSDCLSIICSHYH